MKEFAVAVEVDEKAQHIYTVAIKAETEEEAKEIAKKAIENNTIFCEFEMVEEEIVEVYYHEDDTIALVDTSFASTTEEFRSIERGPGMIELSTVHLCEADLKKIEGTDYPIVMSSCTGALIANPYFVSKKSGEVGRVDERLEKEGFGESFIEALHFAFIARNADYLLFDRDAASAIRYGLKEYWA